jgi:hypothetical protein
MELLMLTDNFIYRVPAPQIPAFWEAIKFACCKADNLDEKLYAAYFNELLQSLLSDKVQCFVVLDNSRVLHRIIITRIVYDKLRGDSELMIQSMYSITKASNEDVQKHFAFAVSTAKSLGCKRLTWKSSNPRIWEWAEMVGCFDQTRIFSFNVGGV